MKTMPDAVTHYKSTPDFTEDTVPAGLLRSHTTAAGVWARINVLEGSLQYHIYEPESEKHLLEPGRFGIIEPQVPHEVGILGPVRFRVEFFR
jgi:tellurite resistance-related uncharacterized protein